MVGQDSQIGWYRECGYGITKAVGISQERSPYPLPSFSAVRRKCFRKMDISNGICEMVQEWGNIIRDIAPNVVDALQWTLSPLDGEGCKAIHKKSISYIVTHKAGGLSDDH